MENYKIDQLNQLRAIGEQQEKLVDGKEVTSHLGNGGTSCHDYKESQDVKDFVQTSVQQSE